MDTRYRHNRQGVPPRGLRKLTAHRVHLWVCVCICTITMASCTLRAEPPSVMETTPRADESHADATARVTKRVSFALLEDYDKGADLAEIAHDFQLMNELEIDVLRCSLGWDDYEPIPGDYDFEWLEDFVALADEYGITLRPYIAYTTPWAGATGTDGMFWNDPPEDYVDWYNFVYALAHALSDNPNVLSYEIYNEENDALWWDGTPEQYRETLRQAALAIRAADPDAQVILGGLVYPDDDWLRQLVERGYAQYYDITPFHAYPESWSPQAVENYLDTQYHDYFVPLNNTWGEAEPIWINEMGFPTLPGTTEREQANWWARAVSTFLAEPEIEHLGIYEIKDLPGGSAAIGDETNYHLGITRADRTKKLAFYTLDMLTDLLDVGSLTVADSEATVTVTAGTAGALYHHLFQRPDGSQILFVYDKAESPTVQVILQTAGSAAFRYALDGSFAPHAAFDGQALHEIALAAGDVAILRIEP